ncbi:P-loop containing nucleoside triphosphate hydrolase protein [Lepidopterella palustris CBS 459.81]|uniref:P-loop containing nucleoside triphosphate hydrolase protein n=1 Tax=Lepidopterella palustris CBS 459.81 TaxID=1314670 RepID=A0A8E2E388_9PEZI|nr:P-loop containing nucleoside triphosphate hydrolase protein [Lepidopterella palustris CBS 459.81]
MLQPHFDMQQIGDSTIWIVGPPGAGKGTQCTTLTTRFKENMHHLSVGDLVRERVLINDVPPELTAARKCLDAGEAVPTDDLFNHILPPAFQTFFDTRREILLLDGFPRSLEQAEAFIKKCGRPRYVLEFQCSESTAKQRFLQRKREGDNEEKFAKRFGKHGKLSGSIIAWIKEHEIPVAQVSAEGSIETVYSEVIQKSEEMEQR